MKVLDEFATNLRAEQTSYSYDINDKLDVVVQMWSKEAKELYEQLDGMFKPDEIMILPEILTLMRKKEQMKFE
jgi:hypothetical protein